MAARISGKSYTLTANEFDLATVALQFSKSSEAILHFTLLGQELRRARGNRYLENIATHDLSNVALVRVHNGRQLARIAHHYCLSMSETSGIEQSRQNRHRGLFNDNNIEALRLHEGREVRIS